MTQPNERGNANLPQTFSNGFLQLRTLNQNGTYWFLARDIGKALGVSNPSECFKRLDEDERLLSATLIPGQPQTRTHLWVNESGLYHLIFTSVKPEAKAFRRWVTTEVLPAIRKTGYYQVPGKETRPDPKGPGHQLSLWPSDQVDRSRLQDLMLDVALQAKASSKVGQLIRLIKPLLQTRSAEV